MKLTLPDTKTEINYGVKHVVEERSAIIDKRLETCQVRGTRVWVRFTQDGPEIIAEAFCHHNDNFCKRIGRKTAANRLLAKLNWMPKRDRKALFEAICPEYRSEE